MTVKDLRGLLRWCEQADDNAGFWRRMYWAAMALDLRDRLAVQSFVALWGILPEGADA